MTKEIEETLGELEAIRERMNALLWCADHPDRVFAIYLIDMAAQHLRCMLAQQCSEQGPRNSNGRSS